MSRIQLSYKIIKKDYVSLLKDDPSLIDTKINYDVQVYDDLEQEQEKETMTEKTNDLDLLRDEIRESLLLELKEQRESIINEAKKEAEMIRLEAKKVGYKEGHDKGIKQGFEQGFNEGNTRGIEKGYSEGVESAQKEVDEIKRNAIKMLENAQEEISEFVEANQQRIIRLAAQMAESIVHTTIDTSSENILQLIKPIVQQLKKVESIIITCNPNNYDYLKKSIYSIEKKYEDIKFIILEDESLEKNGCKIENENQIIDLQIKKQLENIVEKLSNLE
ncbi:MAG: FliH/SctL family protein [Tissierellaceae bacterium]|nr:FliH/SctL family protein [Tissierellaceae bacterium]